MAGRLVALRTSPSGEVRDNISADIFICAILYLDIGETTQPLTPSGAIQLEHKMANIFLDETTEDVIDTIKQTMSVKMEEGTPVVSFATNRGKGSGAQQVAVSEFDEYVEALEEVADNGIQELPEYDLSPSEMVRETIRNTDGMITFRVRGGKGSKPAKIPADRFSEVVGLLRSTVSLVESAAESLSSDDAAPAEDDSAE